MKKMKRIAALVMALALVFALAACGSYVSCSPFRVPIARLAAAQAAIKAKRV